MKTETECELPRTVRDLLAHPGWDAFIGDKLGNDLFINDPERAARLYKAAEDGEDGSTADEHCEDWREFADILEREARRKCETDEHEAELDEAAEALESDIARVEKWHAEKGGAR